MKRNACFRMPYSVCGSRRTSRTGKAMFSAAATNFEAVSQNICTDKRGAGLVAVSAIRCNPLFQHKWKRVVSRDKLLTLVLIPECASASLLLPRGDNEASRNPDRVPLPSRSGDGSAPPLPLLQAPQAPRLHLSRDHRFAAGDRQQ